VTEYVYENEYEYGRGACRIGQRRVGIAHQSGVWPRRPPRRLPPIVRSGRVGVLGAPEAGAQCGSSARWDLCGGWSARTIPTATPRSFASLRQPPAVRPTLCAPWVQAPAGDRWGAAHVPQHGLRRAFRHRPPLRFPRVRSRHHTAGRSASSRGV